MVNAFIKKRPILQGLQTLWNVAKRTGNYSVCNTFATGVQQKYQK